MINKVLVFIIISITNQAYAHAHYDNIVYEIIDRVFLDTLVLLVSLF